MLSHAFEKLHCVRVELKTDVLNTRSRKAMLRIGAKEEGVLRKHSLVWDGRYRDSIYYSILDDEWPAVKQELEKMLIRRPEPASSPR
jgi:RimJ/RimL family protein N-acetyltransferase